MGDIPQPASKPHKVGDHVQVYIGPDDPDSDYHGLICEITNVIKDNLAKETGRNLDAYSYNLRNLETGESLPVSFRHNDVVPLRDD